jgi:hypothetical protein
MESPASGLLLGADALRTRGRPYRRRRAGAGSTARAGAETSGRHGNRRCGTREARPLAWGGRARAARGHPRETPVRDGGREADRCSVPRKPSHQGRPRGPAAAGEGRERAKGTVVPSTRGRTQRRGGPVTGARRRTAGLCGCLRVTTRGRSPVRECRTPGSVGAATRSRTSSCYDFSRKDIT